MKILKLLRLPVIVVVLAVPGLASATALWHESNGEAGATFHPDHIKSTRTRAEAMQELEAARKDGSLWFLNHGLPVPVKNAGPGRKREEVRNEMLNLTVEERRQLQMMGGR